MYLTSLTKGLSTPEPDILDLDTSFDDTATKEQAVRVTEDERMREMRNRLGRTIEATARVWAGDLEVVSVGCADLLGLSDCLANDRFLIGYLGFHSLVNF